jgi:ribosomal protein S18 acetylase RimI-like enzyme
MAPRPTAGSEPLVVGPAVDGPTVRMATARDVPRLAGVLADAFTSDPLFTWMLRGSLRLKQRLRTVFTTEMEQYGLPNGGTMWTTPGYDGAVVELPPGSWQMPKSITGEEALRWLRAYGTRLPRAISVQKAMEERHPRELHFYVRVIGVRTARQGQGIGSALMQPTLQSADTAGLPTYIEASTQRSAALYERLGFVHMDVLELPNGGPPVWLMRRPPARPTHDAADGERPNHLIAEGSRDP